MLCSFLITGLLPPWFGLFLGISFFLLLYKMGNHSEIPLHTSENGHHKQINKQVLKRMQKKGNPSALLVGMQTGAATVENRMEFPQKTKNGTAF